MPDDVLALVGPAVRDEVARCAAAAGYRMLTADPRACRREWVRSRAVMVDAESVPVLSAQRMPRRSGVVVVGDVDAPAVIWRMAVELGADSGAVLPADESALVHTLSGLRAPRGSPGGAVAVIGGHGGAGASTLAAATAMITADAGHGVLLLDTDELGPGLDLMLGVEDRTGLRWQDLTLEGGTVSGSALHSAVIGLDDRLSVLAPRRGDARAIGPDAVLSVIDAGRAQGDRVVVDLPRSDGPLVRAVAESVDLLIVVSAPTVAGCASTRSLVARTIPDHLEARLAIRGPSPGGLRASQVADAVGLDLLAAYRPDPGMAGRLDAGRLRVTARSPLGRAATAVHRAAEARRREMADR
ncbi:septum site-determining protein Ssd [Gordonia soli]|uniref:Rv3660c-like CheY-like N-terminal domain-containing protein n=1 Tax=Gordonia soli NBRC 108243 TaxID=1223545 RepID=M0QGN8_9ACTN|nr:septum site-determining protein Ssd [Gordonia soli]GAC67609.1 hypothetical protein GS4_08_01940 [Gordonia soli NBRC 108243]